MKITGWLVTVTVLLSGCTFNVAVVTPVTPTLTPSETQAISSPVATISATAELPSATPTPSGPAFHSAFFTLNPAETGKQIFFPAGTKQVYAVWSYQNMRPGLTIRREWFLNGQLWLQREETWDMTKYGESGIVRDVSTYDFDVGLPSGVYRLRMYIDNVIQPVGTSLTGQPETQVTFEILPAEEASVGYASPDLQWGVQIFDEKRIVLQNKDGALAEVFTAREVPYVSWFEDSRHFLFVDRDRSQQQPGMPIGIRDDLWIVNVPSGEMALLYKSDAAFSGRAGPLPSPNGRYIASLEGTGFGDACMVDSRLIFFELSEDFKSATPIKQAEFTGLPTFSEGVIYPVEDGTWQNARYIVVLDGTCSADKNQLGPYTFDPISRSATQSSVSAAPPAAGDLGVGRIHGKITDAVTGEPIVGAIVTCQHYSYASGAICSGSVRTDAEGMYAFENISFHDTDRITLTAKAEGYLPQESSQTSFTMNNMEANVSLQRGP